MDRAKPFDIPKREVWEAYKRVKANQGSGWSGWADRSRTLRLIFRTTSTSSGIECRRAVTFRRRCDGWTYRRETAGRGRWGFRRLPIGLPRWWSSDTWSRLWNLCSTRTPMDIDPADRRSMRSGRRGSDAGVIDWVLDLDIKAFFDSIDWNLLMRAVRKHTNCPWVLLYIERWLKAPAADGGWKPRRTGDEERLRVG